MMSKRLRLACIFYGLLILLVGITSHGYTQNPSWLYHPRWLHQEITTKSPEAQIFYDMGITYLYNYEWDKASKAFQKAIRRDPSCAMAYFGLIRTLSVLGRQSPTEVYELLEKSSVLAFNEREQLSISAYSSLLNHEHEEARRTVENLIRTFPTDKESYMLSADIYARQGNHEKSVAMYLKVIELDSTYFPAYHLLGHTYEAMEMWEEGMKALKRYIELAPDVAHAYHALGHLYERTGDYPESMQQYQKSQTLDPTDAHNLSWLARVYARMGMIKKAIACYDQVMSMNTSGGVFTRLSKAQAYKIAENWKSLMEEANSILEEQTDSWIRMKALYLRGLAYIGQGKVSLAESEVESMRKVWNLETFPSWLEYHDLVGRIAIAKGDYENGISHLQQALQPVLKQKSEDIIFEYYYEAIARAYIQKGDLDQAEKVYQEALKQLANSPQCLYGLGVIYERKGDMVQARTYLEKFLAVWKYADENLPEVIDAKQKLEEIGKIMVKASK